MYDAGLPDLDCNADLEGQPGQARAASLRLLSLRARTVAEITNRLEQRFGQREAERTVEWLQSQNLLDDADFADQWRQSRERRRPRSRGMIEQELRQKGVADHVIEDAMEDFDSAGTAYRAASKYASKQAGRDKVTFDRRVGAFLGRRGFEPEVVRNTLHRLRQELSIATKEPGYPAGE